MTAKIIAVCSQKGGVGKSTIAMNLAGALAFRGNRVMVADCDPQGTAMRWSGAADESQPFPCPVANLSGVGGKVHAELRKFVNSFNYLICDCPPAAVSPQSRSVLLVSDLALIPILPSPPDLWSAMEINAVVESAKTLNERLQSALVANQCERTNLGKDVLDLIPDFGIPLCDTRISRRNAYREAAGLGTTVHTLGARAKPAVAEIENLTDEILKVLTI